MGRVVGKSYARQPVNLGTWEPDDIPDMNPIVSVLCLHMEQKLSARLKSHLRCKISIIISPKFENFGDIMVLVAPPSPPPPHANACTGHNFVTNTPIKFIFAIAIEVPDYKNPMIFVINRKNKMASGGHFV